ncbi:hypothetical protein GGQ82_000536 [Sphingobium olei]
MAGVGVTLPDALKNRALAVQERFAASGPISANGSVHAFVKRARRMIAKKIW